MENLRTLHKIDFRRFIGSIFMLSFGIISFARWNNSGELFFLLLAFRDFVASYFLAKREKAQIEGSKKMAILAYVSSALPLLYFSAPFGLEPRLNSLIADICTILGFLIVTWATIDLGTKLGVSPAKRGEKVTKGLYKLVAHPMYLGYVIAQFGWLFLNKWNALIYLVCMTLFVVRGRSESKLLNHTSTHDLQSGKKIQKKYLRG